MHSLANSWSRLFLGASKSSQFSISDGTTTVLVDDDIHKHTAASVGQCLMVTGIMHMNTFDNTGEVPPGLPPHVVLLPRSATDVAAVDCP